jgi:HSP20 family protein
MNLVRRRANQLDRPTNELDRLHEEINRLFDFGRDRDATGLFDGVSAPSMDVVENEGEFLVRCDLPGVKKDDVELSISSNVLTIKGEKHSEQAKEETKYYRRESWSGSFQRSIALSESVDPDKVEAELKDGVMTIRLPKREELKPKQIAISVK